ncbi:MAG: winged helix family two component transcriptional regulator [Firmicutes bacterium]|nr:winged helix family two component transcriptional regulator [Bacillota bacterium]
MGEKRVLIAEDEKEIRNIIKEYMSMDSYIVDEAADGREALELFAKNEYDIILVDIMMPEISGWDVCRKVRESSEVPIIILSAKGQEYDKLRGFELGIDDYIVKPFSPRELLARIKVIFRRNDKAKKEEDRQKYEYKDLLVDFESQNVFVDGAKIKMTPKEYDLLEYLIRNRNMVLSRDMLLDGAWGIDFMGDDRTVDTHVKMLRESLGRYRNLVVTVWGKGYKFEESDEA